MQGATRSGFMNAWGGRDLPSQTWFRFRIAREPVGKAVQKCMEKGASFRIFVARAAL
jgi:hypothetical protein